MKLSNLKAYFISQASKPGAILLVCLLILGGVSYMQNYFADKYSFHKQKYDDLRSKIFTIDNNIAKTKAAQLTWEKIKNNNFNKIGLRIEEAKKVIDTASKDHFINNLSINLSSPVIRKDVIKSKIGLEYSEIDIGLSSYLDTEVFNFIDELGKNIPGLLNYTSIDISSLDLDINDSLLQNIKQGGYKDLVQAKINIVWQDFIRLKESNINDENE
ncbi:hypothetical protein I862_00625 [endosymbiont of Acanthamoeba sp. UWC8]|uniref:hypothetical protein n=1 Tax=endosymbiont of Acanthamoeba sp. UWC8 TaxID=86106 RepID=UPI0004D1E34F|nr:hypothetical protein [endosymbiont of Acanthamoeba sp. UWC8]AIF80690.1 hypothetical protein I862_00625 [endosymbiont of Acanthamoeba sp. UWC8]